MDRSWFAFRVEEFSPSLVELVDGLAVDVQAFEYIPVLFIRADPATAAKLESAPEILSTRASNLAELRMVSAIDGMLLIGHNNWHQTHMNGVAQQYGNLHVDDIPPYPVLDRQGGNHIRFDASIRLQTRLCSLAALNMSLQPDPPIDYSPDNPVTIATHIAHEFLPVVMAAGNVLPDNTNPYIRGWAEAEWVIAVGATTDANGSSLAEYQLVAAPGSRGPTVVAYGVDDRTSEEGTSFAAPRVSEELSVLHAYLLTLRHYIRAKGADSEGIPLTGVAYIDIGALPGIAKEHGFSVSDIESPKRPLPALPISGIDEDALEGVVSALKNSNVSMASISSAGATQAALCCSAREMPFERRLVGHGFISPETTREYLTRFSGADLVDVLFRGQADPRLRQELASFALTDVPVLDTLMEAWRGSFAKYVNDLANITHDTSQGLVIVEGSGRDLSLRPPERPTR